MKDEAERLFLVVCNDDGQLALWAGEDSLPRGWKQVFGPDSRAACLGEIDRISQGVHPRQDRRPADATMDGPAPLTASASRTMFELLLQQAELYPDRLAIDHDGRCLTYSQLVARARDLASELRDRGIRQGSVVALLMERSIDLIVGLFATWHAGATAASLDHSLPEQRLSALLDDCSASLMIVSSRGFAGTGCLTPTLQIETDLGPDCFPARATPVMGDENPAAQAAFCLYTSGSTGRPKGVLVSQLALSHYARMCAARLELNPNDRVLQICSPGFDMALQEICTAIVVGAAIIVYPQGHDVSTLALDTFIKRTNVSVAMLPTSLWRIWVGEHAWAGNPLPTSLRLVYTGGEKIEKSDFKAWRSLDAAGAPVLVNAYGPTETTMSATMWLYVAGQPFSENREVPIGTPNGGYSCYVLDDQLCPVPTGEIGQIAIGGAGVGIGYLGRPVQTAAAFVPDPFSSRRGDRMYLTGDRGRYNDFGELEFIGRTDTQVKVLGYRVEPGEIECALLNHPDIVNAAVIVRDTENGKQLNAYCQNRPGSHPDRMSVRSWLAKTLPDYMVPAHIEVMSQLPMTTSGKLDRRALSMRSAELNSTPPGALAVDALDARLSAIWKLTLGVVSVSPGDNFFDCGGHSLLVTKFIWAIKKTFGLELSFEDIFDDPTYVAILSIVRERSGSIGEVPNPIRQPEQAALEHSIPVTFQQRRLLNQAHDDFASAIRIVPLMLELSGEIDVDRLQRAVDRTLRRHSVFSFQFTRTASGFEQQLADELQKVESEQRILPCGSADLRDAALRTATEWVFRGLDILQSNFVRTLILTSDARKSWLVLGLHHIAVDAQSVHILTSEIMGAYARDAQSGPRDSLYLRYATEQATRVESGKYAQDLAFWADYLRGSVPLLLPRATNAGRLDPAPPRVHAEIIDGPRLQQLRARATAEKSTTFAFCLAALNILLSRITGQEDILLGIPHHNRPSPEYSDCVGYFVNGLPMRMRLRDEQNVSALVASVKSQLEEGPLHLGVSMADVDLPARSGYSRPFQAMVVNEQVRAYTAVHGLTVEELRPAAPFTKSDLTVGITEQSDQLRCGFLFDPGLLGDVDVSRWLLEFVSLIDQLSMYPGDLSTLSVGEARRGVKR